jgi:hypothetical protein
MNFHFFAVVKDHLFVLSKYAWFFFNAYNSHNICSLDAESGMLTTLTFSNSENRIYILVQFMILNFFSFSNIM